MLNLFPRSSRIFLLVLLGFFPVLSGFSPCSAQPQLRVEPPFWWAGMEHPGLQLLVYGRDISLTELMFDYPGITVSEITRVENPDYLFVDLVLDADVKS